MHGAGQGLAGESHRAEVQVVIGRVVEALGVQDAVNFLRAGNGGGMETPESG